MITLYGYHSENSGVGMYTRKLSEALSNEVELEAVEPPRILKPRALNQMLLNFTKTRKLDSEITHITNQDDLGTVYMPDIDNLVVTVHDIFRYTDPDAVFDSWRSKRYLKNLEKADKIIAISKYTKEQIIERSEVEKEKIEVVYQGVDTEEFRPEGDIEYEDND